MDILVEISDSAVSGLKRKAKVKKFTWILEEGNLQFEVIVDILRFTNDNGQYGDFIIPNLEYPQYTRIFVAINSTRLDPVTGEIIDTLDLTQGVGEYDAILYQGSQLNPTKSAFTVVVELIELSIQKADLRGQLV